MDSQISYKPVQKSRKDHLINQRKLQIKNNSIPVTFHVFSNALSSTDQSDNLLFPFFFYIHHDNYLPILTQWLQSKISINVYHSTNGKQFFVIDKENVELNGNCLWIKKSEDDGTDQTKKKKRIEKLRDKCQYLLAKNNATIQLLTKVLDGEALVDNEIMMYIEDKSIQRIPSNKMFQLQQWAYYGLNQSQAQAIQLVSRQKISFIKGPPGCGKTKMIARLATLFAHNGYKSLIGAVTNTANLNIFNSLIQQCKQFSFFPNIVLFINKQLFHENIQHIPQIRIRTFRYLVVQAFMIVDQRNYTQMGITRETIQYQLDRFYKGGHMPKSFISLYYQAMAKIYAQAHVVIVTTTSAVKFDAKLDENFKFKPFIGILDQAAQASWADTYCYLTRGVQKIVLIGDDKQLAPTVISQNQVLKQTIFTSIYPKNLQYFLLLEYQYRMHPQISQFPNRFFYQNKLKNGVTSQQRTSQILYFKAFPVSFINSVSQEQSQIQQISKKRNYWNYGQIIIIAKILSLFPVNLYPSIGIISPYDLQIRKIHEYLPYLISQIFNPTTPEDFTSSNCPNFINPFAYGLQAKTCDGYQGNQKQYIIISCVRSNGEGKIGFCGDESRINVMLTRAKRGLVTIGNIDTFWGKMEAQQQDKDYTQQKIKKQEQKQAEAKIKTEPMTNQNLNRVSGLNKQKQNQNIEFWNSQQQIGTKTEQHQNQNFIIQQKSQDITLKQHKQKSKSVWKQYLNYLSQKQIILSEINLEQFIHNGSELPLHPQNKSFDQKQKSQFEIQGLNKNYKQSFPQ